MRSPWANVSLLIILIVIIISGYIGLISGNERRAWVLVTHGIGAYALIWLFLWKSSIILSAFQRKKRWTRQRIIFAVMLLMLLTTVVMGLLWSLNGPIYIGGFSFVSLHIYLGVITMAIILFHVRRMRFIFRVDGTLGRRLFLGTAIATVAGSVLWRVTEAGKSVGGLVGATRRFTGSYERGSFTGRFPSVSWIFDYPAPIDKDSWRLKISGAVEQPTSFSFAELQQLPSVRKDVLLDCTSGWYTTQVWEGVSLADLLAQSGMADNAASVTIRAVSGYKRRFGLDQIGGWMLAYNVADAPLSHGHGAPLRLVAPHQRGYDWVKWVEQIEVNTTSEHLQSPLPLQ